MTIFQKILDGEIPADLVWEDEKSIAFRDIEPKAPVHVLVIPRKPYRNVAEGAADDPALIGHLLWVCSQIAEQEGIADSGYRVITNKGNEGGQSVDHLHFHLLGGRQLGWTPA